MPWTIVSVNTSTRDFVNFATTLEKHTHLAIHATEIISLGTPTPTSRNNREQPQRSIEHAVTSLDAPTSANNTIMERTSLLEPSATFAKDPVMARAVDRQGDEDLGEYGSTDLRMSSGSSTSHFSRYKHLTGENYGLRTLINTPASHIRHRSKSRDPGREHLDLETHANPRPTTLEPSSSNGTSEMAMAFAARLEASKSAETSKFDAVHEPLNLDNVISDHSHQEHASFRWCY